MVKDEIIRTTSFPAWALRLGDEIAQAYAIVIKDIRSYFMSSTTILWALLMPLAMWTCFVIRQGLPAEAGLSRLLGIITFFSTSSVAPVIILLERRMHTYDRLLVAPMSLWTVIIGKSLVGFVFGLLVCIFPLLLGLTVFQMEFASLVLLIPGILLSAAVFSALGTLFASGSAQMPCQVLIPTMLIRFPLLFISGTFIPINQMEPWMRTLSYFSPLTYAQDLLNHAVVGTSLLAKGFIWPEGIQFCKIVGKDMAGGVQDPLFDLLMLAAMLALFLVPSLLLHQRSRKLGY